jgi:hypothetical protein
MKPKPKPAEKASPFNKFGNDDRASTPSPIKSYRALGKRKDAKKTQDAKITQDAWVDKERAFRDQKVEQWNPLDAAADRMNSLVSRRCRRWCLQGTGKVQMTK